MGNNIRLILKNGMYTLSSNLISFVVNALIVLIIPKLIGVSEYGYFQLYVLLATYALYFHFGWCDGIYLRYVGKDYKELDKKLLSSQFKGLALLTCIVSILLLIFIHFFVFDSEKIWIYSMATIVILFVTPKIFTSVVMQMTNNLKHYSEIVLIEKIVYSIVLSIMLLAGIRDFRLLILSDVLGKIAALFLGMHFCKDIIFTKIDKNSFREYFKESLINIKVGLFLLISNIASILITGIVQLSVESKWSIATFSKVSLTFNMSKMLLVVITALSIVLVPMLKHLDKNQLSYMYKNIRSLLMFVLGMLLLFYYPLKIVLSYWLPEYSDSIKYMALLFPMCLFESKTSLLLNTYLKAMRGERILCLVNVLTVLLSGFTAYITVFIFANLTLTIVAIPYLLMFRCLILECYIGKKLNLRLMKTAFFEVILATSFIYFNWNIDSLIATLLYLITYLLYLFFVRKELMESVKTIRNRWNL